MFWPFKERSPKLYGFNLDKYAYLGYTIIKFDDTKAHIHGFVHKTNGRRYWHLDPGRYTFKPWDRHPYVMFAEIWRIGEKHLAAIAPDFQSIYLEERMKEEGYVWCNKKKWWITEKEAERNSELKVIWDTNFGNKS